MCSPNFCSPKMCCQVPDNALLHILRRVSALGHGDRCPRCIGPDTCFQKECKSITSPDANKYEHHMSTT